MARFILPTRPAPGFRFREVRKGVMEFEQAVFGEEEMIQLERLKSSESILLGT